MILIVFGHDNISLNAYKLATNSRLIAMKAETSKENIKTKLPIIKIFIYVGVVRQTVFDDTLVFILILAERRESDC